jgi:sporulation protein YlmC with PRC-barrel domain
MQRITVTLALATCLTAGWIATAQDAPKSPPKTVAAEVKLSQRASEIIGMKVKNAAGKDLGTINDIVLDAGKGNIRYLAVSYGGWLGLGDKLFAVPHKSFQWKQDDSRNNYLVLNLTEQQLKSAPGFDQNHWPDFATDTQWQQKIDSYYLIEKVELKRETSAR